jgi:hypothetical protein
MPSIESMTNFAMPAAEIVLSLPQSMTSHDAAETDMTSPACTEEPAANGFSFPRLLLMLDEPESDSTLPQTGSCPLCWQAAVRKRKRAAATVHLRELNNIASCKLLSDGKTGGLHGQTIYTDYTAVRGN